MKTKLFSLLLAVAVSVGTMFASDIQVDGIWYDFYSSSKSATVTYRGSSYYAYSDEYTGLVAIPASVTYDGESYSVTSIGKYAFYECSSLTSVTIPNSVTSIGEFAFRDCSGLTSVTIPNSVTSIGSSAFSGCSSLTSINVANDNPNYSSIEGVLFDKQQTTLIRCPGGKQGEYIIPNSVTSIGELAFRGCSGMTSVTIGNSVTSIGEFAFFACSGLTSVTIPNSVTSIGDEAFWDCSSLTSVTIEAETPPTLGFIAFYNTNNCPIYVPCGTLDAYKTACSAYASRIKYAPYSYTITPKAINGYITTISTDFTMCDAEHPVICTANPDRGCYFVRWADGNTDNPRTIELTQDTTLEAIFDYSLTGKCGKDNALTWTFEPASMALNITGKGALSENYTYGRFIESLTIGNDITSIGDGAFYNCSSLTSVTLGTSVKVIEEYAFDDCTAIETITCYSMRPPTVYNNAFENLDYSTIVYVPADCLNTYKMHDFWGLFDVRPIGASKTETTEVKVEPTATTADFVWPAVENAATYELVIKDKNGNVVYTLIFNANGQLTQIAFNAPARNNTAQAEGFAFTVTGLSSNTQYGYSLTAKDANEQPIATYSGSFTTTSEGIATGVDNTAVESEITKILRNGEVLILRGGKTYTIQGVEVK